jgi:hypothetical protein
LLAQKFYIAIGENNKMAQVILYSSISSISDSSCYFANGYFYDTDKVKYSAEYQILDNNLYDKTCILNNSQYHCESGVYVSIFDIHTKIYVSSEDVLSFCEKKDNCHYSSILNAWVCSDGIKCPPGQEYNYTSEQCEDVSECPTFYQLDNFAVKKCVSLDFVKYRDCDPNTGKITIICKTCNEVLQLLHDYCTAHDGVLSDGTYECSSDPDTTLHINFSTDFNVSMCEYPTDNESNTSNGNDTMTDNNSNDNNNNINNNNNSNDSNNNNSNDNNSDNSNTNNSNSNLNSNNTCPDACSVYNKVGVQTIRSIVNGYTCYTITYPVYENCSLKYHFVDGKCVNGCGDSSNSANDDISKKIDINISLDKTNGKLDNINNTLNDIKNSLNLDVNFTSPDTDSGFFDDILSEYNKSVSNFKNDFISIKTKFDELKTLFDKNKKYNLNSPTVSKSNCFEIEIHGEIIKFDLCSPLKKISPILVFVITLILNFYLVIFSIKHMFKD